MKKRFPSQVFNQAGILLFSDNKGPLIIKENLIQDVQRGVIIEPSRKITQQEILITGNTIERAIRTALSIGWGWNARALNP